ncbi:MAG: glycosyltransferase family 2 protein [Caulobacteraceae bacterium]
MLSASWGEGAVTDITCVIPAFENLDLLARCLTSVAAQRDVDLEIVVTDDSKSGLARDFAASLATAFANIRYLEGPRSGNPVDNWNHGLAAARGRYCALVHHDEFLIDPRYLRRAVDRLDETRAIAAIGPAAVTGVARASRFRLAGAVARALGRPVWTLPILNWIGPTAAFVFRRGPRFDPDLVQLADVEFYRRVLKGVRPEILAGVCVGSLGHHGAQITATIDPPALARRELAILAARSPPAVGPFERAIFTSWLGLRSWLG